MGMRWLTLLVTVALPACLNNPSTQPPPSQASLADTTTLQTILGTHGPSRSFRWKDPMERKQGRLESPVSLTATDGTGLKLSALRARAVVEDPLAFTELHLTFENPQNRVIEGHFRSVLPEGASVSRFAMRIGERWQEGEVVELQAARRAYEDFLHRRQDPALLEQGAGNEFQARVFPIPARGSKEIILSYAQERVSPSAPFRIPLRGLPELGVLDIRVLVGGAGLLPAVEEQKTHYVPATDFEIPAEELPGRVGLRSGGLVVARVTPELSSEPDEIPSLLVLVDTSASRALAFEDEVRLVHELVRGFKDGAGSQVPLLVAAFDQEVELVYEGPAGGFGPAQAEALLRRQALGASDLRRAIEWAANKPGYARALVVTDGVATAGDTDAGKLKEAVLGLRHAKVERIDAIALGGIRDEALLRSLVSAGLPRDGTVIDGLAELSQMAGALTCKTRSGIQVKVDGANWYWPHVLDGVRSGDAVLVYADVPAGRPLRITLDDVPVALYEGGLAPAEQPLVERASVKAQIAALASLREETVDAKARSTLKDTIVALSTRHRVLSPFTALLVLETEEDYLRFHIDRNALADVLTVGETGMVVQDRSSAPVFSRPVRQEEGQEEGKMGRSAPRASGQYALGPVPVSPAELEERKNAARRQALDQARRSSLRNDFFEADREGGYAEGPETGSVGGVGRGSGGMGGTASHRRFAEAPVPATPPGRGGVLDWEWQQQAARNARPPEVHLGRSSPKPTNPYTGPFLEVMTLLARKEPDQALLRARAWRAENPGDVMALVALGEVSEQRGDLRAAARAYGSLIDLFPARADLRRFAGERLERISLPIALDLAADTFAKAVEQRPDHPASHRLRAFALLRLLRYEAAFDALESGLMRNYPDGRFAGAREILAEDLGLIAAAWSQAQPERAGEIRGRLRRAGGRTEDGPSLRFVLNWETDANDVDFHIYDRNGEHAFYSEPSLPSGGRLYADVTTGYGPECFTIRGAKSSLAFPYTLQAHYYSRGPMGYGMGKLEILWHDGRGGLRFEERPFVVMQDQAYVDLGTVRRVPSAKLQTGEVRR